MYYSPGSFFPPPGVAFSILTRFSASLSGCCSCPVFEEISALLGWSWEAREKRFCVRKTRCFGKNLSSLRCSSGWSPFLVVYSPPIFGWFLCRKTPFGKKPSICWEKSLDLLLVLYQSSGDLCGFSWSFCSAGRLLFSTLLGEILAPLAGLWKLSAPSLLFLVLIGVGLLFIRCDFRIRTFLGKNLFVRKTRG